MGCVLSIDQGATSTRTILLEEACRPRAMASVPLRQIYPAPGQVEQDANEIWNARLEVCGKALREVGVEQITAIGISNHREGQAVDFYGDDAALAET